MPSITEREFAVEVVRRLRDAGHEALWAGGCVREPDTALVAAINDIKVVLWHVDPKDWLPGRSVGAMLADLQTDAAWGASYDSVVLLHDGRINTPSKTAVNTIEVIEPLVEIVRGRGWEFDVFGMPASGPAHRLQLDGHRIERPERS